MQPTPNPLISMLPIAAIFAIFYLLVIRPQQRQAKEHQKLLESLKKGDRVLTNSGIYGTVVGFRDADVELKIAENVKVLLTRSAVSRVLSASANGSQSVTTGASASN